MRVIAAVVLSLFAVPMFADSGVEAADAARAAERNARHGAVTTMATCPSTPVTPPVTISGQLKSTSCTDILGLHEDVYAITGFAGQTIEINYSSTAFETFLYMYPASSEFISSLSTGVSRRRIRYTFQTTSTFHVEAEALYSPGGSQPSTGPYTLSIAYLGGCQPNATTACLLNSRFSAKLRYRAAFDNSAVDSTAQVKSVTGFANGSNDTVFFYFNDANNIEVMLKMLDQGNTNNSGQQTMAVLYGTATPLRIELTITDTKTSGVKTYVSDFGKMGGGTDFTAFVK